MSKSKAKFIFLCEVERVHRVKNMQKYDMKPVKYSYQVTPKIIDEVLSDL